jgi:hypothetical protein
MDQNNSPIVPSPPLTRPKLSIIFGVCCFLALLFASVFGIVGYQMGYSSGNQQKTMSQRSIKSAKKIAVTPEVVLPNKEEPTPKQPNSYALIYTSPPGWRSMVWQPDPNTPGSAMLSPDYSSFDDPEPQTGLAILIYQFPQQYSDIKQMRPDVEATEDNMKGLSQITVAGFPTLHAIFVSTDSHRVVDDYNILKDHDRWIVRIVTPGNSLPDSKAEEQKYNYQISELLKSIQFKIIQYR